MGNTGGGLSTVQVAVLSVGCTLLAVIALVGGIYLCHTYCRCVREEARALCSRKVTVVVAGDRRS